MAVKTKLEVDYSQFKKGMAEAEASVKMLNAALKNNEAQFKASGDAEKYASEQANLLTQKLNAQKEAAKNAEQMLLNLGKRGVSMTSVEYQRMAQRVLNAQAAVANTQAEINKLNGAQTEAAGSAKTLSSEVEGIGKKVSLQNVSDGLSKLTNGMEKAYRTAVRFGRAVVRSAMDATGWADDVKTRAVQYGLDVETVQKMDQAAAYIDTDVDTIISAKDRLSKNRDKLSELLGISTDGRTVDDVFWEAGDAIKNLGEEMDQNDYAMQIFGKGWRDLLPLFEAGREQYEAILDSQSVLSDEQVEKLAQADDAFKRVQQEVENLKRSFWAENAGTITEMLKWIVDNKGAVVAALTAIAGGFAALKVAETAANIIKIADGLKDIIESGGKQPTTTAPNVNPTTTQPGTTPLISGGGFAGGIADWMTSTGGMLTIGSLMLTPLITKLANGTLIEDPAKGLSQEQADLFERALHGGKGNYTGKSLREIVTGIFGDEKAEVPVEAKVEDGEAEKIAGEIGTVTVPVNLRVNLGGTTGAGGGGGGGLKDYFYETVFGGFKPGFANGIPFVPRTQLALLHQGERVLTARENRTYTFNNNTYFGGVNLHNGLEVDALTDSIARQQARQAAAYGS